MNLTFSTSYYHPYVSGLTIGLKELAEGLTELGHSCKIITNKHDSRLKDYELINGVKVKRFNYQIKIYKALFSWDWLRKTPGELKDAERVILNLPQPEGFIVAIISRLMGKKIISWYVCDVSLGKGIKDKVWEIAIDLSSLISLVLSENILTYTDNYAHRSRVLKYFLSKTNSIYPPVPGVKEKPKIAPVGGKLIIGMGARVAKEKGFEEIVEALPIIEKALDKPVILRVAGSTNAVGEKAYAQEIIEKIKRNNLKVYFLGTQSKLEMEEFYKTIDLLAVPSTNSTEAFGLVQVEAMKRGVPVVASDLPGVKIPVMETGMGILCKAKDAEDLATKITWAAQNKEMLANKYPLARKIFDYWTSVKIYEKSICN